MNFEEFQEFRKILCICPCCGDLVRLSDLHIKSKKPSIKTWLDDYEKKVLEMEKKEEKFDEKEEKLREIAREKGRKEAEKVVNQTIDSSLKNLKLDPFDVKPLLNPVDFVVFDGLNKKDIINRILILSKKIKNPELNLLRQQVKKAVLQNKYEWQVARINERGDILFE